MAVAGTREKALPERRKNVDRATWETGSCDAQHIASPEGNSSRGRKKRIPYEAGENLKQKRGLNREIGKDHAEQPYRSTAKGGKTMLPKNNFHLNLVRRERRGAGKEGGGGLHTGPSCRTPSSNGSRLASMGRQRGDYNKKGECRQNWQ